MICRKCKKEVPDGKFCLECGANQTPPAKAKRKRGNGQGTVVKRGATYTAIYTKYINGERITRTKGGFKKRADAYDYIPMLRADKQKGVVTLNKLYNEWSTSAMLKLSNSKQTAYKIAWGKLSAIQHNDIAQLTIGDLQAAINNNAPTYYPARDMKVLLSHLYKRACAQGDVLSNLAQYIVLPELEEKEAVPFSKDEIESLWKDFGAGNTFTGYILLMIYTGMMPGELLACKKDMIDWDKRLIVGAGLKTKKRKQTPIALADMVLPVLNTLCGSSEGDKLMPVSENKFYELYYEALARSGCRKLTPYSCRHTTGTGLAVSAKLPPSIIQEIMRHSKFATTQRYIHPDTDATLDGVNKLAANSITNTLHTESHQTH